MRAPAFARHLTDRLRRLRRPVAASSEAATGAHEADHPAQASRTFQRVHEALKGSHAAARGLGGAVLALALPHTCIACGQVMGDNGLCGPCWSRLAFITPPYCERTGLPLAEPGEGTAPRLSAQAIADPPAFDRARAAVLFTEVARDLVHNLKYADRLDLAAPMARLMAQAGRELIAEADLIVPVPLQPLRLWKRRFNQAALLARHLSSGGGPALRTDLLRRLRATPSQTHLGRAERRANVAQAFAVRRDAASSLEGRRVLLVDDVYTTGATLDACARALRRAGASGVDTLTFARVADFS